MNKLLTSYNSIGAVWSNHHTTSYQRFSVCSALPLHWVTYEELKRENLWDQGTGWLFIVLHTFAGMIMPYWIRSSGQCYPLNVRVKRPTVYWSSTYIARCIYGKLSVIIWEQRIWRDSASGKEFLLHLLCLPFAQKEGISIFNIINIVNKYMEIWKSLWLYITVLLSTKAKVSDFYELWLF